MNQQYRCTAVNCVFITYIDKIYHKYFSDRGDEDVFMQDDYSHLSIVVQNEDSINNINKDFRIPVGLPWHMIDEVNVPVNCDGKFHWVLVVTSLKKKCTRTYEFLLGSRNRESSLEIHKLVAILPAYLADNHFLEKNRIYEVVNSQSIKE